MAFFFNQFVINQPVLIGKFGLTVFHRTGNSQNSFLRFVLDAVNKFFKELIKLVELTSFEFFIITDNDLSVVGFYCDCKARICSPDVSHKYHLHILEEN